MIWSFEVPKKILLFLWRAASDIVPVHSRLQDRGTLRLILLVLVVMVTLSLLLICFEIVAGREKYGL